MANVNRACKKKPLFQWQSNLSTAVWKSLLSFGGLTEHWKPLRIVTSIYLHCFIMATPEFQRPCTYPYHVRNCSKCVQSDIGTAENWPNNANNGNGDVARFARKHRWYMLIGRHANTRCVSVIDKKNILMAANVITTKFRAQKWP